MTFRSVRSAKGSIMPKVTTYELSSALLLSVFIAGLMFGFGAGRGRAARRKMQLTNLTTGPRI